jgi:hypothetical protein
VIDVVFADVPPVTAECLSVILAEELVVRSLRELSVVA